MQNSTNAAVQVPKLLDSMIVKIFFIMVLGLLLLIPTSMVHALKNERMMRQEGAISEINEKWGQAQTITGPVISVPYKESVHNSDGEEVVIQKTIHFLPDQLEIIGHVEPEIRRRSIYEAVLYKADVECVGSFKFPVSTKLSIPDENILWHEATVLLGITDLRGLVDLIEFEVEEEKLEMVPSMQVLGPIKQGVSTKLTFLNREKDLNFKLKVRFNGSQRLFFTPVGSNTKVSLSSSWDSPSFIGSFLPSEHQIDANGFDAKWNVFFLNRTYPQYWVGDQYQVADSNFGLSFFIPADIYLKSERALKYAIMFILFTFAALLISEIILRMRIHPIQYLMIGVALVVFYSLLLSLGEHIPFNTAYFLASSMTILLISLYARSIHSSWKLPITLLSTTSILYGYLFIMLQLGDFALLMGSTGLFLVLGFMMYATRKIDWYTGRMIPTGTK